MVLLSSVSIGFESMCRISFSNCSVGMTDAYPHGSISSMVLKATDNSLVTKSNRIYLKWGREVSMHSAAYSQWTFTYEREITIIAGIDFDRRFFKCFFLIEMNDNLFE